MATLARNSCVARVLKTVSLITFIRPQSAASICCHYRCIYRNANLLRWRNQGYRNQQLSVKHITVTGCTQRKLSETALPLSSEDTETNVFVQNSTLAIQTLQSSIDKSLIFYKNTFYGVLDLLEKKSSITEDEANLFLLATGELNCAMPAAERARYSQWMWRKVEKLGVTSKKRLLPVYLKVRLENKDPVLPIKVLEMIESLNIQFDENLYSLLLASAAERGLVDEVRLILQHMKSSNMSFNRGIYNSVILGYCKAGNMERAEKLVGDICSYKLAPDSDTYGNLMVGYAIKADLDMLKATAQKSHKIVGYLDFKKFVESINILATAGHKQLAIEAIEILPDYRQPGEGNLSHKLYPLLHNGHGDLAFELYKLRLFIDVICNNWTSIGTLQTTMNWLKISMLEKLIAKEEEEDDLMIDWFKLVSDKNELVRQEADIIYLSRQQELEAEHKAVEQQLRELVDKPDLEKSTEDKNEEEYLMQRLLDLVNQRSSIVDSMDEDRIRYIEEDKDIAQMLKDKAFKLPPKKSKKGKGKGKHLGLGFLKDHKDGKLKKDKKKSKLL